MNAILPTGTGFLLGGFLGEPPHREEVKEDLYGDDYDWPANVLTPTADPLDDRIAQESHG